MGESLGNILYDRKIQAFCLEHGVYDLRSEDRDFKRFEERELDLISEIPL
jgi:hypothetical protein